jgi:hypothetical protein
MHHRLDSNSDRTQERRKMTRMNRAQHHKHHQATLGCATIYTLQSESYLFSNSLMIYARKYLDI